MIGLATIPLETSSILNPSGVKEATPYETVYYLVEFGFAAFTNLMLNCLPSTHPPEHHS